MKLRGIDFGPVWGASGVEGFFGEGYWFHQPFKLLRLLNFEGMTFVAKTTTLERRDGNMPLHILRSMKEGQTTVIFDTHEVMPVDYFPDCIYSNPWKEVAVNAVGLSSPGANVLLGSWFWQARTEPFFLSFMSVADTAEKRKEELHCFVDRLGRRLPDFKAPVGLQINFSCPNIGLTPTHLIDEIHTSLSLAADLEIPLMPKINLFTEPVAARVICEHEYCDALCITNTIPWNKMWPTLQVDIERRTGLQESPVAQYGGGGVSGECLRTFLLDWLRDAQEIGITKPINAGGGITRPEHVSEMKECGADSISIGSAIMFACGSFRPWRVQQIIQKAHSVL